MKKNKENKENKRNQSNTEKNIVQMSVTSPDETRRLEDLTRIYCDAFSEDPAFIWIYQQKIKERFQHLCPVFFHVPLKHQSLYYSGNEPNGFAGWIPPQKEMTFIDMLRFGFFKALYKSGFSATVRLLRAFIVNEMVKSKHMPKNSWYLFMLAIDQGHRNRKIGEKLMAPVLKLADENNRHCYTESTNEQNLNFYKRLGFEVAYQTTMGKIKGAPPIYFLLRKPQ